MLYPAAQSLARSFIEEVIDDRNLDLIERICAPAVTFCTMTFAGSGLLALRKMLTKEFAIFPGLSAAIEYVVGAGPVATAKVQMCTDGRSGRPAPFAVFWSFRVDRGQILDVILHRVRTPLGIQPALAPVREPSRAIHASFMRAA